MESIEILALTDVWAGGIFALLGIIVGGGITYWIQRSQLAKDRIDKHNERLRMAYGSWAGALRIHTETHCIALQISKLRGEKIAKMEADKDGIPFMAGDIRDRVLAEISTRTNEEAAFGIIMITDTNKVRVDQAQDIRSITHTKMSLVFGSRASEQLKAIEEAGPEQSKALSKFLVDIAAKLSPRGD